jgi:ribonuclease E
LNEKRDSLLQLEATYNITIFLVANHEDIRGTLAVIERAPDREGAPPRRLLPSTPIKMDSAMLENDDDDVVEEASDEEPIEEISEGDEERTTGEASEDGGPNDGRRRRRRGRRGGRGRDRERGEGENVARTDEDGEESNGIDASDENAPSDDNDQPTDENAVEVVAGEEGASEPRRERGGRGRRGGGRFGRDRERGGRDRGRNRTRTESGEDIVASEGSTEAPSDDFEAPASAPVEGDGAEPTETKERGDRPPRGRDRNGRGGRERGRGGRERNDRNDRGGERSERPAETFTAPPAFKLEIPEVIDNPEPRKWQPPTPTVAPVVTERKAGWWSKKT